MWKEPEYWGNAFRFKFQPGMDFMGWFCWQGDRLPKTLQVRNKAYKPLDAFIASIYRMPPEKEWACKGVPEDAVLI